MSVAFVQVSFWVKNNFDGTFHREFLIFNGWVEYLRWIRVKLLKFCLDFFSIIFESKDKICSLKRLTWYTKFGFSQIFLLQFFPLNKHEMSLAHNCCCIKMDEFIVFLVSDPKILFTAFVSVRFYSCPFFSLNIENNKA